MPNARLIVLSLFILSLSLHLDLSTEAEAETPAPSPSLAPSVNAPARSPLSSMAPAPSAEEEQHTGEEAEDRGDNSSRGGLSGSKKAGLAIGVIVAASVIVLAGMVYKKRKHNRHRSHYAYAVRREFL